MGGSRFDSSQPEAYLFGENKDLNFLGNRPTPFPYPAPQAQEPTRTLKSLVNIRRDSLKFVRDTESEAGLPEVQNGTTVYSPGAPPNTRYNIEFTFDTDVKCAITIHYFAVEEIINRQVVYRPLDPNMSSETFHYKRGANQVFCQPAHFIDPSLFSEEEWQYNSEQEIIPIVIHCSVEEEEHVGHAHMTLAVVDKAMDGSYALKSFKQKQIVDGLCYLLQEIYGIENKNTERAKLDDDFDDTGSECVICMSDTRDTLILPCRHLCLCSGCADSLRYQANNCPICRAKFRVLLQLRALRRVPARGSGGGGGGAVTPLRRQDSGEEGYVSQEGVPAGYEAVALVEALNGPTLPHRALNMPAGGGLGPLQPAEVGLLAEAGGDVAEAVGSCVTTSVLSCIATPDTFMITGKDDSSSRPDPSLAEVCNVALEFIEDPCLASASRISAASPAIRNREKPAQNNSLVGEKHYGDLMERVDNSASDGGRGKEASDEDARNGNQNTSEANRSPIRGSVEIISELSEVSTSSPSGGLRSAASVRWSGGDSAFACLESGGGESDSDSDSTGDLASSLFAATPVRKQATSSKTSEQSRHFTSKRRVWPADRDASVDHLGRGGVRGNEPHSDESRSSSSASSRELLDREGEGLDGFDQSEVV